MVCGGQIARAESHLLDLAEVSTLNCSNICVSQSQEEKNKEGEEEKIS